MTLPDFEWSTANIPDEDKIGERDIDEISVSNCDKYDVEEFIKENFGEGKIYLEPIPIQVSNKYSSATTRVSTPFVFPKEVICYLQEKGVETIKVETATTLKWYKDEYRPPYPEDSVWYGWKGFIDQEDQGALDSVRRNNFETKVEHLKNHDDPPDEIKKGFTTTEEETVWERTDYSTGSTIDTPEEAYEKAQELFEAEWTKERAGVIFLNSNNEVMRTRILEKGTKDHVEFPSAIELNRLSHKYGAEKIIHIHNHPSGTAKPSMRDKEAYGEYKEREGRTTLFDETLNPQLFDMIVIGNRKTGYEEGHFTGYYSFKERFDKESLEGMLSPPIKIKWNDGESRSRAEHLVTHRNDGMERMFEKKTQVVVKNIDEAQALLYATGYDNRGDYQIYDGNEHYLKAVRRVYKALVEELRNRGFKLDSGKILNNYQ